MGKPEFVKLETPEKSRRYFFANFSLAFDNVTAVCARPSGTHRLETADGKKHIVSAGWLAITIETDRWTF